MTTEIKVYAQETENLAGLYIESQICSQNIINMQKKMFIDLYLPKW